MGMAQGMGNTMGSVMGGLGGLGGMGVQGGCLRLRLHRFGDFLETSPDRFTHCG